MKYNFDEIIDRRRTNSAKYRELKKKFGAEDVIPLWVADMDFKAATPIIDAIIKEAEQGVFGYTYRPDSYNQAFAEWQIKRNGYSPDLDLCAYSPGVVPSIIYFVKNFTSPGDGLLIQTPVYSQFINSIERWGRRIVNNQLVESDGVYSIDFKDFENKIVENDVKLFILCNPHNPVGRVWTQDELVKISDICLKHGVLVISDEIHSDLILKGKHSVLAGLSKEYAENTISLFSATKTFNLAGLHASTIVFNNKKNYIRYAKYLADMSLDSNNTFSLVAMESAFRHCEDWLEELLDYLRGNVDFVKNFFSTRLPIIKANYPEATYLMWLDCRELGMTDADLASFMVNEAKLGMNTGISFGSGGEGHMRLNLACPRSVLELAMNNLEKAIDKIEK